MPKSRQTITLPNTYVGAQPNFIYAPSNGGYHADFHGMSKTDLQQITAGLAFHNLRGRIIASLNLLQNKIDTLYANFSIPTDTLVEQDLSAAGLTRSESREGIKTNKDIVDGVIKQRREHLAQAIQTANLYSGGDPLSLTSSERAKIGIKAMGGNIHAFPARAKEHLDSYAASYKAAKEAKILTQVINGLVGRAATLSHQLAAAEAAAQAAAAKAAAEAAAKAAAEKAAAEAAAKVAAEKAAAEAVAKVAAEKAAAEAAAKVAAETAALAANETNEAPHKQEHIFTFTNAQEGAAQLSVVAGAVALTAETSISLESAIQVGIQALKAIGSAIFDRATGVGIGLLVHTTKLGNSDLYPPSTLTVPARSLAPQLPSNLEEVASRGGTVDIPYRIYGQVEKYSIIATSPHNGVSSQVPVRALTLNSALNAYTFTTDRTPARTLIFPIAAQGSSSTTSPVIPVNVPVYTGLTLTPIASKAEALPAIDTTGILDGIYVFPVESGIPPIYAVFSSPYEGATTKGEHSGRMYNPEQAGGPIQNLDWTTASVTQEGIDLVKLHTGRFPRSEANRIMIDRLEQILIGVITITDIDKRFYTHEIRELERYRAIGVDDGVEGSVWNDAHTATLEDYRINENRTPLYTAEADAAGEKDDYANALKEK